MARTSRPSESRLQIRKITTGIPVVPFDDSAAAVYGAIRAELEAAGRTIGPLDLLIAAHALAKDMTLVTNNLREFRRIAHLRAESWV